MALLLVTHFRLGVDAFTLGRNVTLVIDVDDSQETTTDNFLDSMELLGNQTSTETNDSLEVDTTHLVVKRNPFGLLVPAVLEQQQQPAAAVVELDSDYSWDDLMDGISKLDRTEPTVASQPSEATQQFVIDHDDSLEDVLEDLVAQQILGTLQTVSDVQQPNAPAAATETATPIAQSNVEILPADTSSVGLVVVDYDDDGDFSLEDYTEFVNPDAIQLTTTDFHHLPETLFTHPTSDDWFLVKHFMDDHYVWELGDELAKEYFWQPVKATDGSVLTSTGQPPVAV